VIARASASNSIPLKNEEDDDDASEVLDSAEENAEEMADGRWTIGK
jgi:hypothetical protein